MKKILILTILTFVFALTSPTSSLAQGMNDAVSQSDDGHTAREEAEGREIWSEFQDGRLECEDLTDEDFGALGEYFMGQMAGDSHEAMNNMMISMMGQEGEEEMHVAMGKRMSDCDPNAAMPQNMMNGGMMNNLSTFNNFHNPMSMMNFGSAPLGWIFMFLFWVLIIIGIVSLIKLVVGQTGVESKDNKSALNILKERYSKGEINKKEFEEKRRDIK